ncbi:MerR family transcriptional regulator [Curtobacterium luteum]|uniref:MerR family transcriptional regulator n=1 Tax=Curtobacterium luteum TaxID=33881 RepID=UPI00382726CA
MRIGELAERTGASVRSLRYYEQQGLLRSERTGGGQRDYAEGAVEYVHLIRCCLRAGLPTKVIAEIMPCMHSGTTTEPQRALLQGERAKLEAQIAELTELRERLDWFIGAAEGRAEVGSGTTAA